MEQTACRPFPASCNGVGGDEPRRKSQRSYLVSRALRLEHPYCNPAVQTRYDRSSWASPLWSKSLSPHGRCKSNIVCLGSASQSPCLQLNHRSRTRLSWCRIQPVEAEDRSHATRCSIHQKIPPDSTACAIRQG